MDINKKDYSGKTPLMYAADIGNLGIVEYLVMKKANVDSYSIANETAVMKATLKSHLTIVEWLVS